MAVLPLEAPDDPEAIWNQSDLREKENFEAYADYVYAHAGVYGNEKLIWDVPLVTIIFWGQDAEKNWLAVIAQEEAAKLE